METNTIESIDMPSPDLAKTRRVEMQKQSTTTYGDQITELRTRAAQVRDSLQERIAELKEQVTELEQQCGQMDAIANPNSRPTTVRQTPATSPSAAGRIDWTTVLNSLPQQFTGRDVHQIPMLRGKRSSEIYAGLMRWMKAGLVQKESRGVYRRV